MSGMDLPRSGPCRHDGCKRRAVRAGVCIDHWTALWGAGYGPWPADVEPVSWRDHYLKRTGVPYVRARDLRRSEERRLARERRRNVLRSTQQQENGSPAPDRTAR